MELKLKAETRPGGGKGEARKLRASGRVPGVLYGSGVDATPVAVDARDLYHALHTSAGTNVLVGLVVDGKEHLALPREIQRDHVRGRFLHVDFLAVRHDVKITVDVPVHVVGEAPGVKTGGVIEHHLWEVHLECLPADVPDSIEADISNLELGDALRIGDLTPPPDVTILTNPDELVLAVVTPQVILVEEVPVEEEAVEAEAAPEAAEAPHAEEAPAEEGGEG